MILTRWGIDARPSYYERFKEAFVTEVNEFTACVLDDKRESGSGSGSGSGGEKSHVTDTQLCLFSLATRWKRLRSPRR